MSIINSSDTIGNRTRDHPACSTVPQLTAECNLPFAVRNAEQLQWKLSSSYPLFHVIREPLLLDHVITHGVSIVVVVTLTINDGWPPSGFWRTPHDKN
jgi:hypothetical protein